MIARDQERSHFLAVGGEVSGKVGVFVGISVGGVHFACFGDRRMMKKKKGNLNLKHLVVSAAFGDNLKKKTMMYP